MRKILLLLAGCLIYSCTKDISELTGQSDGSTLSLRLELNSDITDGANTEQSTRAILPEDISFENTIQDAWIVVADGTTASSPIIGVKPLTKSGSLYTVSLQPSLFDSGKTYKAYIVANVTDNKASGDITAVTTLGAFQSFKLKPAMTALNNTVQAPVSLVKISSACDLTVNSAGIKITDTALGAVAGSVKMKNVASRVAVLSDAFQKVSSITLAGVSTEGTLFGQSSSTTTTITDTQVGIEGSSMQTGYYYVYPHTNNSLNLSINVADKGTGTFTIAKALTGGTTYIVNCGTRITGVFPHVANTVEWSLDANKESYVKLLISNEVKFDLTFGNAAVVSVKDPVATPWLSIADGTSPSVNIVSGGMATVTAGANTTTTSRVGTLVCEYTINGVSHSYELKVEQAAYSSSSTTDNHLVVGYFPSWSDNYNADLLLGIPEEVTCVFLSFAKPNLTYTKGSYDISTTGIQVPYDGTKLKSVISTLHARNTKVILSIGGETYWNVAEAYNINYQQIADLVRDLEFDGIDWDFEPNGSFATIGNADMVQQFITMISSSRELLPRSEGFYIACAPAGCGALGGEKNDDSSSPYRFANRATMTGESESNTYKATDAAGYTISFYGFESTGHMIPVFQAVGGMLDFIAFQGYNVGSGSQRELMYDSYAYYANIYGFRVAAGMHVPNEPWGPYYTYTAERVDYYSTYIANGGRESRKGKGDGVMFWQLLMKSAIDSSVDGVGYCKIAYNALENISPLTTPSVSITSPQSGGIIKVSTAVTVGVSAKRVTRVDVYVDDVLKSTLTAEPYSYAVGTLETGYHTFKVVGTNAASGESATASVTVKIVSDDSLEGLPIWSATTAYNTGDIVVYDNCAWKLTVWTAVGQAPGSGGWVYQSGGSGQPVYAYNSSYFYVSGALVTYNGSTYKAGYYAEPDDYPGKTAGQWIVQ